MTRACIAWMLLALVAACGSDDAGQDSAPRDAGLDANGDAKAGVYAAPTQLLASTDRVDAVALAWTAPPSDAGLTGYRVLRDGVEVATTKPPETTFVDATALEPTLNPPLDVTATNGTDEKGVALTWKAASAAGTPASYAYTVQALYGSASSAPTEPALGGRTGSITDYQFSRDDGATWASAGMTFTHFDADALRAQVTMPEPIVSSDAVRGLMHLELPTAPEVSAIPLSPYRVRAISGARAGLASTAAFGKRASKPALALPIQWQRSAAATDAQYTDLPGVTGRIWFDSTAPAAIRYFRARIDAPWAEGAPSKGASSSVGREFRSVSAGEFYTCGVRAADNSVSCWGANTNGRAPPHPTAEPLLSVAASTYFACGLRVSDSSLTCWGMLDGVTVPSGPFARLVAGQTDICGIRADGTIACFAFGNISPGTYDLVDQSPPSTSFSTVAIGRNHTCAIRAVTGELSCFGDSSYGEAPATLGTGFKDVAAGRQHTCAIDANDKMVCIGDNSYGQAPPGPSTDSFKAVAAGGWLTCGIRNDDKVICFGFGVSPTPTATPESYKSISVAPDTDEYSFADQARHWCGIGLDDAVHCNLANHFGEAPPTPPTDAFASLAASSVHTCGLRASDGKVLCWGDNEYGQAPPGPSADSFKSLIAGFDHTCGNRAADGLVVCWGANNDGVAPPNPSTEVFKEISGGDLYSCGLRSSDSKPVCWGANLGASRATPPPTDALSSISVYELRACGIRQSDGHVLCWGRDNLGNPIGAPSFPEVAYDDVTVTSFQICVIRRVDGNVLCEGPFRPFAETTAGNYKKVIILDSTTCAVRAADDRLECWSLYPKPSLPLGLSADAFKQVVSGVVHACGIRLSDSRVTCWGNDDYRQAPKP